MPSSTAEYMALFRALESVSPLEDRLFSDPYAVRFLRPFLQRLVTISRWRVPRRLVEWAIDLLWPGARASGVARTRLIDDLLTGASNGAGIEQVVVLGAGFDCRAHRQLVGSTSTFLEVDRPETQQPKRERLRDLSADHVRYVPCDFESDSLAHGLEAAGFDAERLAFFLWEGVTNYLDAKAVEAVLRFIGTTAPGSVLLFTYVDRLVLDEPERFHGSRRLRTLLWSSGESWTFGLEPSRVAGFLRASGLRLVCDAGSVDYRARYLGSRRARLRGYEFYRTAVATVAPESSSHEGESPCPR